MSLLFLLCRLCLGISVAILSIYALRHYVLTIARLNLRKPRGYSEATGLVLPHLSVLVPMHNEEKVAADLLRALVGSDYDRRRLEIIAINDRSTDRTGQIINHFAAEHEVVHAIHRTTGPGGKPAALEHACSMANGDILVLFDADYIPGRGLLKQLVAPFCDPEIGAVMGRVVPHNVGDSLLSSLLAQERAAGYQVQQQARYNLGLLPQFGGTAGGVRKAALLSVGGWNPSSLTEDTDLTCRLALRGWKVAYVNGAECYEEVPKEWAIRHRQLRRWVMGHNECLHRFGIKMLQSEHLSIRERIDSIFMLASYWTAPLMVLGLMASLVLYVAPEAHYSPVLSLALLLFGLQAFGNHATFIELGSASLLDGSRTRILLLPFHMITCFAGTYTICEALLLFYLGKLKRRHPYSWQKTARSRTEAHAAHARTAVASSAFVEQMNDPRNDS